MKTLKTVLILAAAVFALAWIGGYINASAKVNLTQKSKQTINKGINQVERSLQDREVK